MTKPELPEILRDHANFVEARCPDGEAVAEDMRLAAEKIDWLCGEIGEARQSFKDERIYIAGDPDQDSKTIRLILRHLDALYLPNLMQENEQRRQQLEREQNEDNQGEDDNSEVL